MNPSTDSLATPLAWALAYAALGWRVLPIEPGAKHPIGKLVPRGMLDASMDTETIHAWWAKAPKAGIGIALNQSGLVAVDVDPRNGGNETFDKLQAEHGSLRSDVMAFTGGGGEHHVFVVPDGAHISLPGTLGPGVDLKANGYIVVEPSLHPSGKAYAWEASSSPLDGVAPSPLPDWLRMLRVERQRRQEQQPTTSVNPEQARQVREALWALDADGYDEWITAGMAMHSTGWGPPAFAIWAAWSQQSDKFDPTVCRQKWASFKSDGEGVTIAWIFGQAQSKGWQNPAKRLPSPAAEHDPRPEPPTEGDARPQAKVEIEVIPMSVLDAETSTEQWVVDQHIPADSVGIFFGGSGAFKSFVAIDLAMHVVHGMDWLGQPTMHGPVLYIAAEGGRGIRKRLKAWRKHNGIDSADAPFYVIPHSVALAEGGAGKVYEAVEALGIVPVLVCIDTMSQTFSGNENAAHEVSPYLRDIAGYFRATWYSAVMVVHHTGHSETERPRGSSTIQANVDWVIGCFRDEDQMLATVQCLKQKDAEKFEDVTFELGKVEINPETNSLVASAIVSQEQAYNAERREMNAGRGNYYQVLLDLLQDGMEAVELRHAFYKKHDGSGSNMETIKKSFSRAKARAMKAGIFEIVQGRVILGRAWRTGNR